MADERERGATVNAQPPFTFGIGLQGELIISWVPTVLPDGTQFRMHLCVPAEEVPDLRRCLNESKDIQETLAVKMPEQGAH